MREHALPQDVVGYKFHIIGNMTIKQFAEVAAGCVVGFIIYQFNLPGFLKIPLILSSAGFGALLAFVPYEERPLDMWVYSFFRALYRPTQYYWAKLNKIPDAFTFEPADKHASMVKEIDLTPARRQRVKEYLHSVDTQTEDSSADLVNPNRLGEVMDIFNGVLAPLTESAPVYAYAQPQIEPDQVLYATAPSAQQYQTTTQIPEENLPEINIVSPAQPTADTISQPQVWTTPIQPLTPIPEPAGQIGASVSIPATEAISITPSAQVQTDNAQAQEANIQPQTAVYVDSAQITPQQPLPSAQSQQFVQVFPNTGAQTLQLPAMPNEPNKIVGVVTDNQGTPIQNAIVEIITPSGMPARAVKTNILGQFFVSTPLNNGTYYISTEKEGFQFTPLQLEVVGKIIPPVGVQAQ